MDTPSSSRENATAEACCCGCGSGDRREFVAKLVALGLGATAYVVPAAAGVVAALNPLRLKGAGGEFLRLAALDTLPSDGTPRKFPVVAERVDAWTRAVEPIGAVFLRRTPDNQVEALQVECPHAGCTIELKEVADEQTGAKAPKLVCPCHKAAFDLAGKRLQATSPSPRDLDQLQVEIRNGNEVWVQFQNFKLGTPAKVEVA
jgi:menaquinol-cytochrome c reductase iron-sulfur subunit